MKILALDFSSSIRSVALVQFTAGEPTILGQATEQGTRETNAFKLIENVLNQAAINRDNVDALAIGLGPGSYGGIRVSLSVAQGWQMATQIKTAGIETVHVLAETARKKNHRGQINVVVDAQRNEFYRATFELDESVATLVCPLEILTRAELESSIASETKTFGPDLGDRIDGAEELFPDAEVLAQLVGKRKTFVSADQLLPVYIRPVEFVKAPQPRTDLQ